jgi:hypothetical protein
MFIDPTVYDAAARSTLKQLGAELTPDQDPLFYHPARHKIGMGGERAGKSLTAATYLTARHQLGQLFWIVSFDYELAVPEFEYVIGQLDALGNLEWASTNQEGPRRATTKTGQTIETKSGQDVRRIAGWAPDGILGCEIALWPPELFLRVLGRLAEKRGWFLGTGSYESSLGWLPETVKLWEGPNEVEGHSFELPSWGNLFIFPGGWDDPAIQLEKARNTESRFMERFGGRPSPPSGRVFREARALLHINPDVHYEPGRPVYLAVDPGWGHAYAVEVIQEQGNVVNVIDELYLEHSSHEDVVHTAQTSPWWKDVSQVVIDIAGRQHHGHRSANEVWRQEGRVHVVDQKVSIRDGIDRVKSFLLTDPTTGRPRLQIHPRCRGLTSEMGIGTSPIEGGGIYSYPTDRNGKVTADLPRDRHNDASKALAYFLVHQFGTVDRRKSKPTNYIDSNAVVQAVGWGRRG